MDFETTPDREAIVNRLERACTTAMWGR